MGKKKRRGSKEGVKKVEWCGEKIQALEADEVGFKS